MEEKNGRSAVDRRLITGFSMAYYRDESCSFFLAADQWTVALLSLETLSMQACPGSTEEFFIFEDTKPTAIGISFE